MQDPSIFTIPCTIGSYEFGKALCDSRASINLVPLYVVKRLSLGELTPTTMTLQMVDKTMAQLEGILEDVLIKVGKFFFPMDFVVIDMEEDKQIPLLLGIPCHKSSLDRCEEMRTHSQIRGRKSTLQSKSELEIT